LRKWAFPKIYPVNIFNSEPKQCIPAIVDPGGPVGEPISIFESGAIVMYLGEKAGKFWPKGDFAVQMPVLEWLI